MTEISKPIRLGFVGLSARGWAATTLAPPLFTPPLSSKYSLVAVSTTTAESAEASATKYSQITNGKNVKPYHGSAEYISRDEQVDLVAVVVKPMYQKEAAMHVIEAGKDLFLEMPVGRSLSETKEICEAARKKGIKTIVGCQMRFAGYAIKIKSMVTTGEIGKIYSSTLIVSFTRAWGPTVFDFFKYAANAANGATLLDVAGGHVFDLLRHILGPVASLSAVVINHHPSSAVVDPMSGNPTGEDIPHDGQTQVCVTGLLHTAPHGCEAFQTPFTVHFQSGVKEAEFSWVISAENGTIRVQADRKLGFFDPLPEMYLGGLQIEEVTKEDQKIALAWEAFANGASETYADVEDALKTKEVIDAVKKSSKEGRRIDLLS